MTDTLSTLAEPFPLLRTKLQKPRLPGGLILRRRLLDRLKAGLDRKLTLISAMAGSDKTTRLAQWLEECVQPSVLGPPTQARVGWLSLDGYDNHPIAFLSYLCGAV
jgi:LuxR family maltose regulon positive regulatory protein